jgi:protease II
MYAKPHIIKTKTSYQIWTSSISKDKRLVAYTRNWNRNKGYTSSIYELWKGALTPKELLCLEFCNEKLMFI